MHPFFYAGFHTINFTNSKSSKIETMVTGTLSYWFYVFFPGTKRSVALIHNHEYWYASLCWAHRLIWPFFGKQRKLYPQIKFLLHAKQIRNFWILTKFVCVLYPKKNTLDKKRVHTGRKPLFLAKSIYVPSLTIWIKIRIFPISIGTFGSYP